MKQIELFKNENFNGVQCDFYTLNGERVITRDQLGAALGYTNQRIYQIHKSLNLEENKDFYVLNKSDFDLKSNFKTKNNVKIYLYTINGITEICMNIGKKGSKVAETFLNWSKEVISQVVNTGSYNALEHAINKNENLDEFEKQQLTIINKMQEVIKLMPDNIQIQLELNKQQQQLTNYRMEKNIQAVQEGMQEVKKVIQTQLTTNPNEFRDNVNNTIRQLAKSKKVLNVCTEYLFNMNMFIPGDKYALIYSYFYSKINNECGVRLETRLANCKKRLKETGSKKSAIDKINKLDIVAGDKSLILYANSLLQQLQLIA